jgi:hypothetical protein
MTRTEFVRGFAERSGLDPSWAGLGFIDTNGRIMVALPCGCDDESCGGWAMLPAGAVLQQLQMYAPTALRDAYNDAVEKAGGE